MNRKNQQREAQIQIAVVQYIRYMVKPKYPNAVLIVNPLADTYFGPGGGRIMKQAYNRGFKKGIPDILILQETTTGPYTPGLKFHVDYPGSVELSVYTGIALELKSDNAPLWRQDGELITNDHIAKQADTLRKLRANNIIAEFAPGFDQAKAYIDWYFSL